MGDYFLGVPNPSKSLKSKLSASPLHSYFSQKGFLVDRYVPAEWNGDMFDKDVGKYRKIDVYSPVVEDFRSLLNEYFADVFDTCSPCYDVDMLKTQIPRSSSSGFEYAKYGIRKGDILDDHDIRPGFSGLDVALNWFYDGCHQFTYASIAPKDEVRDASKVMVGKVRSFMVMPFSHYVGSSMLYFQHHSVLVDKFSRERRYGNRFNIYTSYGVDRYHLELEQVLSKYYAKKCYSGDAHAWDGSLLSGLLAVSCDVLWRMLLPCHRTFNNWVRHCNLTRILIATPYLYAGRLCFKQCGMPSGAWHTLVINTIYHIGIRLLSHQIYQSLGRNVTSLILGDDNVLVGDVCVDVEIDVYRDCGVTMEYEEGFSFLQCELYLLHNHYVLIPHIDKIVSSLSWRSRNDLPSGMTDIQSAYIRCCAMRNLVWPHSDFLIVIEEAIAWLCNRLVDGVPFSKLRSFSSVHANYLSNDQLQYLWFSQLKYA